jgi:hypothetical protein
VAPPVFKTGLAGIAFAGGFDSLPPPLSSLQTFPWGESKAVRSSRDGSRCRPGPAIRVCQKLPLPIRYPDIR